MMTVMGMTPRTDPSRNTREVVIMRRRSVQIATFAVTAALGALVATLAWAQTPQPSAEATSGVPQSAPATRAPLAAQPATRTYDLDFTLPTAGKSGCLVCHGDPNLIQVGVEETATIFVDGEAMNASAHTLDVPCTGCHIDFASTAPHDQAVQGQDWISSAKLACKNCHQEAFSEYSNGSHSLAGKPGETATETARARVAAGLPEQVPLCGDCHGSHEMPAPDDVAGQQALHLSGLTMCGQCHEDDADSYNDYYHGRAYRQGVLDAPACWDCHGYHMILPSSDRASLTHPNNLSVTCGREGCHDGAIDDAFLEYAELIHGDEELREANPVQSTVGRVRSAIGGLFGSLTSVF